MRTPKVGRLLAADASLGPVVAKALEIGALSKLCVDYLPRELGRQIRAANFKGGQLVILAATSAAAAKLKLESAGLVQHLAELGAKVNGVSVRVQPTPGGDTEGARQMRTASLSAAGVAALQELHHKLRDSPARAALAALLEHHAMAGGKPGAPTPKSGAATPSPQGARKTGSTAPPKPRRERP